MEEQSFLSVGKGEPLKGSQQTHSGVRRVV